MLSLPCRQSVTGLDQVVEPRVRALGHAFNLSRDRAPQYIGVAPPAMDEDVTTLLPKGCRPGQVSLFEGHAGTIIQGAADPLMLGPQQLLINCLSAFEQLIGIGKAALCAINSRQTLVRGRRVDVLVAEQLLDNGE